MTEFWIFFEKGVLHILDRSAYEHLLFFIALSIPYTFKEWKKLLLIISIFTFGHILSLLLSVFGMMVIKINLVEFLIPITILLIAFVNLFASGKSSKKEGISVIGFVTLFFGMIHGLCFADYFKTLISGSIQSKLLPLLEFFLGLISAQIIVVFIILIISYIIQTFFRFSKRDWTLVMSSFVIGVVLQMIISSEIWNR